MGAHCLVSGCVLLLSIQATCALYTSGGPVKVLTPKSFQTAVIDSDVPAIVEFFAPWCGHCQQLAPTYTRVAESLHGIVTVGAVDCDAESNKGLCAQYQIRGFPTLKVFPADKQKRGKGFSKTPEDYNGPRSAKAIADAGMAGLTDAFIQRPKTEADFAEFKGSSLLSKVVLFTDKAKASALYKSLSMRFRGRLSFAEVRDVKGPLAAVLGVISAPTLLVLPKDDGEPLKFEGDFDQSPKVLDALAKAVGAAGDRALLCNAGKLKAKDLVEFLKPFAGPKIAADGSSNGTLHGGAKVEKPFAEKKQPKEDPEPISEADALVAVDELGLDDIDSILEEDDVWLLGVYQGTPDANCSKAALAFGKLVHELGGLAKAGRVNISGIDKKQLSERGLDVEDQVACAHALVLKPFGEQSEPEEALPAFSGDATAKAVQTFVLGGYPSEAVPQLTKSTIGAFMAGDPATARTPKVLLFTNKKETPPLFAALAANTRGLSLAFAAVHENEKEVLDGFKITKVPAMLFAWTEEVEEQKDEQGRPMIGTKLQPFPGPFRYSKMVDFIQLMTSLVASRTGGPATSMPPVQQANNTADYQQLCGDRLGLCVIGVMNPAVADHAERLTALRAVSMKRAGLPLHFLWVDARQQKKFISAFGLQPGDAPTAVVLSPRKKRFAVVQGALEPQRLHELLEGLLAGRQRTSTVDSIPGLEEGVAAADDAAQADVPAAEAAADSVEPVEEEFDLSDIMGEEIEGDGNGGSKAERLAQVDAQLKAEAEEQRRQKEAAAAERQRQADAARAAAAERIRQKRGAEAAAAQQGDRSAAAGGAVRDEL